ncbi:MAG: twin-arginine translocase subunit TatC [Myxococcaceae bacterium]|nr:twin-arginine translocase subunit TatC [Myxococcaceae bacterium]
MSLAEHLTELRSRLLRVTIAVVVLGAASLAFAKPIFGLLMEPVLAALPPEGRSLIYTSGIEEINVLMKVGLYSGVFLATPVLLWQIWGFVSPGLYPSERKFAGPFVVLGTLAFILGGAFSYFIVLPSMFEFLLNDPDAVGLEHKVADAKVREEDALRAMRFGDLKRASALARAGSEGIASEIKESLIPADPANKPSPRLMLHTQLEGLGRLMDTAHESFGPAARPVLRTVMDKRAEALDAYERGDYTTAQKRIDEAAAALAAVSPAHTSMFTELWRLEKDISAGTAKHAALSWTRPMLTMSEQLSLVLLLELAFGVIFELPIVMALLGQLGLVKSRWLFRYQRHALVVCLIAAAVITPTGDAVNLALMCGPMFLCYELGVIAVWIIEKRRAKQVAETALAPPGS